MKRISLRLHATVCLLLLTLLSSRAQTITTVVGTGAAGSTGDGGLATIATLNVPYRVVVDATNNLLIVEQSGHRIRRVSAATGVITTIAGTGTAGFSGDGAAATAAQLNSPNDVTLDNFNGDLIIADTGNHRIRRIVVATGIITTVGGDGTAGFGGDNDLATAAQLNSPFGVVVESNGNILITDLNNNRIRCILAATGNMITLAGTGVAGFVGEGSPSPLAQMRRPRGITLNAAGNIFFSDTDNQRVRRITAGIITTVAGNGTAGFSADGIAATNSQLNFPHGLAVHPDGSVFIADTSNNRIRMVGTNGIISTFAGATGAPGSSGDGGPAAAALLRAPHGMAFDSNTNLFFADRDNNKIRRIAPPSVGTAPTITVQPQSASQSAGSPVALSVTANGASPLTFQWFFGSGPVAGATSSTLAFNPAQLTNSGNYFVTVTNSFGSVTSTVVTLTITNSAAPPAITLQPVPLSAAIGDTAVFTVGATGTTPISYQWQFNGADILGATNAALSLANVQPAQAGLYRVRVFNLGGSTTSLEVTLTVANVVAPVIISQPQGRVVAPGSPVTFAVSATGTQPFAYQWKRNGLDIAGANVSNFSIAVVQTGDAGSYSVIVSNAAGSALSAPAILTVLTVIGPPFFTLQPVPSQIVNPGQTITLVVAATGTDPLGYLWRRNATNLNVPSQPSLVLNNIQPSDSGTYDVTVFNTAGVVVSSTATITVRPLPVIFTAPQPQTIAQGGTATFSVSAGGTGSLNFQWRREGQPVTGATAATLTLNNVQVSDAGLYDVVVTDTIGSTTSPATALVVLVPPLVVLNPVSQMVVAGTNVQFTAQFSGNPPPAYKWFRNGVAILGATSTTLTLTNVTTNLAGLYILTATNLAGTATSSPAQLVVVTSLILPPPPTPLSELQANGFNFSVAVEPGRIYRVQASTNLMTWTDIGFVVGSGGLVQSFLDRAASNRPNRFYRVVTP